MICMMNDDQEIWPADFFDKTHSHTQTHTCTPGSSHGLVAINSLRMMSGLGLAAFLPPTVEVVGRYMQAKAKNGLTNNHAKNQNQNRKSPLPPI